METICTNITVNLSELKYHRAKILQKKKKKKKSSGTAYMLI